jgi:O-antigen ligase
LFLELIFIFSVILLCIYSGPVLTFIAILINGLVLWGRTLGMVGFQDGHYLIIWSASIQCIIFIYVIKKILLNAKIKINNFKSILKIIFPWIFFTVYLFIILLLGNNKLNLNDYGTYKFVLFILTVIFPSIILLLWFLLLNNEQIGIENIKKKIEIALFIFGFTTALKTLFVGFESAVVRVTIYDAGPLGLARNLAIGLIAMTSLIKNIYLKIPIGFIFLLAMFYTGSRGPFLAIMIVLCLKIIFEAYTNKKLNFFLPIILFLMIITIFILYDLVLADFFTRGSITFLSELNVITRIEIYKVALMRFFNSPLIGSGLGKFIVGTKSYPHNLFLELLAEIGIIGFALFIIALRPMVTFNYKNPFFPYALFSLIASMFSGDLTGTKILIIPSVLGLLHFSSLKSVNTNYRLRRN